MHFSAKLIKCSPKAGTLQVLCHRSLKNGFKRVFMLASTSLILLHSLLLISEHSLKTLSFLGDRKGEMQYVAMSRKV